MLLYKTTVAFAFVKLLQVVVNIAKIKIIYDALGSDYLAKFYIWQPSIAFLSLLISMGIPYGLTTYLAKGNINLNNNSVTVLNGIFGQLNYIYCICFLFLLIAAILLSNIELVTFNYKICVLLLISAYFERNKLLLEGYLRGVKKVSFLIQLGIIYATVDLLIITILSLQNNKEVFFASFLLPAFIASFIIAKKLEVLTTKIVKPGRRFFKKIMPISLLQYTTSLVNQGSSVLILKMITWYSGIQSLITFQTANRLILGSSGFIMQAISSDFYPQIAGLSNRKESLVTRLNKLTKFCIIVSAIMMSISIFSIDIVNENFFDSKEILQNEHVFVFAAAYLILFSKQLIDNVPALYEDFKGWIVINISNSFSKIILVFIIGSVFEGHRYDYAFFAQCIFSGMLSLIYIKSKHSVYITKTTFLAFIVGILIILLSYAERQSFL
jgi:O-antigen/teichoic acid export membrane protein